MASAILSFSLSAGLGAIGACIAIAAARIIDLILNNIAYKKYLKISLFQYYKTVYLRSSLTVLISFGTGLLCHFFMPIENLIIKFLVDGVIFVVLYIVCTLFITFSKKERDYYIDTLLTMMHIRGTKPVSIPRVETVEETPQEEVEELEQTSNEEKDEQN